MDPVRAGPWPPRPGLTPLPSARRDRGPAAEAVRAGSVPADRRRRSAADRAPRPGRLRRRRPRRLRPGWPGRPGHGQGRVGVDRADVPPSPPTCVTAAALAAETITESAACKIVTSAPHAASDARSATRRTSFLVAPGRQGPGPGRPVRGWAEQIYFEVILPQPATKMMMPWFKDCFSRRPGLSSRATAKLMRTSSSTLPRCRGGSVGRTAREERRAWRMTGRRAALRRRPGRGHAPACCAPGGLLELGGPGGCGQLDLTWMS